MIVKKLKIRNFKKFENKEFDFNDDINIIVGDNESGKSTLLEAIELCLNLNFRGRPLSASLSMDLFNNDCIQVFLAGDKRQDSLPEILIEAYLDEEADLKGTNNVQGDDVPGLFVRIFFDPDLGNTYAKFLEKRDAIKTLPIEFYKFEWYSFAWNKVNQYSKKIGCLFVDPQRLHPTYGTRKYISHILRNTLDANDLSVLNLNFRQLKQKFDEDDEVSKINDGLDSDNEVTEKNLEISVNISSQTSWESSLQLNLDSVPFPQVGKGEQHKVQIKLALWRKAKDTDVIMIEEPENHLTHINLVKLIKYIEDKSGGQQIFLTTHSSYVLNKLSFNKLCLLSNEYKRLHEIEASTIKTLKRLPGYDTLRAILSQKVILVEGPSDELVLKKIYRNRHDGRFPEEDGIDVIVVRGIGFKNYLNIVRHIRHDIHVVKDNDGDYRANIVDWIEPYNDCDFIEVFSPQNNEENSLEPSMIESNGANLEALDKFARVILSAQTFAVYDEGDLNARKTFLKEWYLVGNSGRKKVDSAMLIFDSAEEIEFSAYLKEAIEFGE